MTDTNKDGNGNITKYKLSKGIGYFETFITTYKDEKYERFGDSCFYISKNKITSQTIANFVNEGAKLLRSNSFNEENDSNTFKQIATKIGQLIVNGKIKLDKFTSQAIANTFNGLAKCYVDLSRYVDDTFIEALVDKIQNLLNKFNSIDIANTFNGLAKCGVNLGKYFETTKDKGSKDAFIKDLVGRIQTLLKEKENYQKQFTSQELANTFNGLAQCGVNLGEYFETKEGKDSKNAFIKALVGKIQTLLSTSNFKSQELANTFNGLVKLFLYNEVLYEKNISQFKNIINDLVQKYFKQLNRDDQSDWTMLYNIKYLQVCGFKINVLILSEIEKNSKPSYSNDVHTLKLDALNNDHTNSALEKNFKTFLENFELKNKTKEILERKDDYYESESELIFEVTSNTSFKKPVDFYIEFKHKDKIYKAYIELDGPTHFTDTEQTQETPQTQIRDILTLKQLQEEQVKADDNTQILYVTLSANEFNKIKDDIKVKEGLFKFLIEKDRLKQITKKTSNNSKMAVEYKSIYDSVNDVASKTMDIEDYTTPTPRQMVSRLGQEARKEHPQERKRTLKDSGLSKDNGQKILKKTKYTMVDDQLEPGVMQNSDDKSMKQDESIEKNKSAGQHF